MLRGNLGRLWAPSRLQVFRRCVRAWAVGAVAGGILLFAAQAEAQWPDPGGDAEAAVPVPPTNQFFGFNDDTVPASHGLTPADYIHAAKSAGANAIRGNLEWRRVEPARNQYTGWGPYDDFYDGARAEGLTPIFILAYAPVWARDVVGQLCGANPSCAYPPAQWEDAEWRQFVTLAAQRYPDAVFEIWNEPNLPGFWAFPNPERYAQLQVQAYNSIKAAEPNTTVLSAGFANVLTTQPLGQISIEEFLQRAYAANPSIKDHMDALAFHPYPGPAPPDYTGPMPPLGADSGWARGFAQVRGVRDSFGDEETPLFLTETGISRAEGYSEQIQVSGSRRIYRKALTMPDVIGVVFHRVIEPKDSLPSNGLEHGFAWLAYGTGYPADPFAVYCGFVSDAGNSYPGCS